MRFNLEVMECNENKIELRGLSLEEVESFVLSVGEPKYRAKQIFEWIYKGVSNFEEMKNLPQKLILKLEEKTQLSTVQIAKMQSSKSDGTRKYLLRLRDENFVEAVFMKYKYGNSLCLSTQVGCRMGCKFCASTLNGLARNLSTEELISQLMEVERDTGERISHIVLMGIGEPFDNYTNIAKFLRILNHKSGLSLSMRNITVSTCGIVPMIEIFAKDFPQANLAISLHSADNLKRSALMPINRRYPLEEIISACKKYIELTNRRITFEYTLIQGENDDAESASKLSKLLRGLNCHINLIRLNKVEETGFEGTSAESARKFQMLLANKGIQTTVRRELGSDIDAACGQLRLNAEQ